MTQTIRTAQQLRLVILSYAVIAVSLYLITNTTNYLLAALAILLSASIAQARGILFAWSIILVLHLVFILHEFTLSNVPLNFWLNQALLIVIASISAAYFRQQKAKQHDTSSHSYQTLFEQTNDGVFLLDATGKHSAVNDRAVEMLGYASKAELTKITYREIVDPEHIRSSENVLESLLAGKRVAPYERVFRKKDGSKLTVEINVQLITADDGKTKYIQSIVRDVSERKEKEEQLRISETRFRTFFEHSPVSIWEQDFSTIRDYLISLDIDDYANYFAAHPEVIVECARRIKSIEVNNYTLHLFRAPDTRSLLQSIFTQIKNNPSAHALVQHQFTCMALGQTEIEWMGSFETLDGTPLDLMLDMKIFPGYEGTWGRVLLVMSNITELKHAELELKRSNTHTAEFRSYLERLHHLTIELGKLDTLDELYKAAVIAARTDLGFSRAALLIADYADNLLRGTYGTSPEGELRAEHDYSEQLQPSAWFDIVRQNKNRVTLWEDTELLEYGTTLSTGWKAAAALWSGDENLGYFVVDNHLSGKAPRPYEQDLLSLFSTKLANLITRRRSELLLQSSQELLHSTFASLSDAIFVLEEATAEIEDCNDAALELFGYTRDELIGKVPHFVTPKQSHQITNVEQLATALADNVSLDYYELQHKDGTAFYADIQISPLQTRITNITHGWVMVVHDMTERKAMEQKLINFALEKERVNTLQQLITNLRHDIATPLSTIKTSLYMLGRLSDELKRSERLDMIDKQVSIIQTTLEAVTEMTRMDVMDEQDLDISPVNLNVLLTVVHRDLLDITKLKQQTFNLGTLAQPIVIQADESRLRAAVDHIVKNAIQFTAEQGTIDLSCEIKDLFAVITVKDTGIGISDEDLIHIFDRLYRGQRHRPMDGSLGIGLPIAKRIIELHGGYIKVDSTIDVGSRFCIYLPFAS